MPRSGSLLPRIGLVLLILAILLVVLAWWLVSPYAALVAVGIAVFAVLVAVSVLVLPARLVARDTDAASLNSEQRASAINSVRSTLVQGLVGLAALAGIFVAWQQLQTDREQSRTDREQSRTDREQFTDQLALTRQGQVAERFTGAVDQLGSAKLEQRLGGIYALERIAEESASTRLQVFEVLTGFVRERAPRDRKAGGLTSVPELRIRAPDVQAVLTVLARRTVMRGDPRLDLRETDLRRADVSGVLLQRKAQFQDVNLSGAQLQGADFDGAQLQRARLVGAQLQGAKLSYALLHDADLEGAQLQDANLSWANFESANLEGAQLQRADLQNATLHYATLIGAQLQGARLVNGQLQDAKLHNAQLQRADLLGAWLDDAYLSDAQLQGANLDGAQLQRANLDGAQLQGAHYDAQTTWPDGFNRKAAGVTR